MTDTPFSSLDLPQALLSNLNELAYQQMTPIQALALPPALARHDLIAQAKTGSGKTAAFAIPLLIKLNPRFFGVQGLVLCPTRELSTQVATEIRRLARYQENIKVVVLCGGQSIGPQIGSLEHGAHIVVGTPGRINDHLNKKTLDLSNVKTLVLDEADRMLDMGFMDDIALIIGHIPKNRQTLLFSATYPDNIKALSAQFQREPQQIKVEAQHTPQAMQELFVRCDQSTKLETLVRVLQHIQKPSAVIFCNTKQATEEVAKHLDGRRFNAVALHGDLEQRDRDQVLTQFKHQSRCILVATDVAARGLDVEDLPAVINFDLPSDPQVYIHRIGRTARAGKEGLAVSLVSDKKQHIFERITSDLNKTANLLSAEELSVNTKYDMLPSKQTLVIAGGRKDKIRPGDILGALTKNAGIPGSAVGKIDILDFCAYVTLELSWSNEALAELSEGKIKGRRFKVRKI